MIKQYEQAVIALCQAFCDKHGYDTVVSDYLFVRRNIGDIIYLGDEFWNVHDIYYALKEEMSHDEVQEWYWSRLEDEHKINLPSWHKGLRP